MAQPQFLVLMVNQQQQAASGVLPCPALLSLPATSSSSGSSGPPSPTFGGAASKARKPAKWRSTNAMQGPDIPASASAIAKPAKPAKWRANQTLLKGEYHQHRIKQPKPPPKPKPEHNRKWAKQAVYGEKGWVMTPATPATPPAPAKPPPPLDDAALQQAQLQALQAQLMMGGQLIPSIWAMAGAAQQQGFAAAPASPAYAPQPQEPPPLLRATEDDAAALLGLSAGVWDRGAAEEAEGRAELAERSMRPADGLHALVACVKA